MTRTLTSHLSLRLLALIMSGVILAPGVLHAYNITRNDNVRPVYLNAFRFAETNAHIPFDRSFLQLAVYVSDVSPCPTSMLILTMIQLLGTGCRREWTAGLKRLLSG